MLMTRNALELGMAIASHSGSDNPIEEKELIRAYAAYSARSEKAFHGLLSDPFFRFPPKCLPADLSANFISYPIDKFIATIVPNAVGDCQKIARMIDEKKLVAEDRLTYEKKEEQEVDNNIAICFAICFIKDAFTSLLASIKDNKDDYLKDKGKEWLYSSYLREVRKRHIPYIAELVYFNALAESVLLLRQDSSMNILNLSSYDKAFKAMQSLYSDLGLCRTEMIWFLAEGHTLTARHVKHAPFSSISDKDKEKKLKDDITDALNTLPSPASALAIAENTKKKATSKSKSANNQKALMPSDAPIELSLVFSRFAAEAAQMRNNDECLVLFPSALFVMKWADCRYLTNKKVKFVIPSEAATLLLNSTYGKDSIYRDQDGSKMKFTRYEEWVESLSGAAMLDEKLILIFENHTNDLRWIGQDGNISSFTDIIENKLNPQSTIYCLSPESYLDNSSSLLNHLLKESDKRLSITETVAIPRKGQVEVMLFNNTKEAQKLFWKAENKEGWSGETRITFLRNDSKILKIFNKLQDRWEGNGRMLTQEGAASINISLKGKIKDPKQTLRQYCFSTQKKDTPRKDARKPVEYSEEITFWYTITMAHNYKTKDGDSALKMKIEVVARHFNRPKPETEKGTRGKGKNDVIKGSLVDFYLSPQKAADKNYVKNFILKNYPKKQYYSTDGKVKRYPRKIISDVYQEELKNQDLTIKTILFIHEELDAVIISGSQGKRAIRLHDVLRPILNAHCSALTANDFVNAINETIPNRSTACYMNALHAIRDLVRVATHSNPNDETLIDKLIDDEEEFSRTLSKLRSALGKKHLSLDEFIKLYKAIVEKLDSSPIYYGILIRLFTGLESNIVAALCWKDYKHNPDYDFHYLTIYRQASGNGQNEKLQLRADSNIRRLPISSILEQHLEKIRPRRKHKGFSDEIYNPDKEEIEQAEDTYDDVYAAGSSTADEDEAKNKDEDKNKTKDTGAKTTGDIHIVKSSKNSSGLEAVSPNKLDNETKKLLEEVFGKDDDLTFIIPCEDNEEGLEQSLARYKGGFIFRENLRYWLTRYCAFDADQISHYLGNSGATTLGKHYLDSNCTPNQYLVASKIWRFDALLAGRLSNTSYKGIQERESSDEKILKIEGNEITPIELDLIITAEAESMPCTIKVRCEHGLAACIVHDETEGESNV